MSPPKPKPRRGAPPRLPNLATAATGAAGGSPPAGLEDFHDLRQPILFGNAIIILGFIAFLAWAAFAPLDQGVPATGTVVVESLRKTISTLNGGTVSAVHVHENQSVKVGDVLLTLDDKKSQSAYDLVAQDYVAAWAKLARLTAEQGDESTVVFPDELVAYAKSVGSDDQLQAQDQLFRSRKRTQESEQSILKENLAASAALASGYRMQLASRQQQIALLRQEVQSIGSLVDQGYSSRNQLLDLERQLAELRGLASDLDSKIAREASSQAELRLRLVQSRQTFKRDVEAQIADTRREVANLEQRLKDAHSDVERTIVRAQVSGQVISLLAQAPGTVLTPGAKIMEIVPDNEKLLLDVQVPTNLIDHVGPGLKADVRFNTFPDLPQLTVEGVVRSVSSDRHEPQYGAPPYYLARVELTPKGLAELKGKVLRPGMPADVVIKTGERSFLAYLMDPISRRAFTAMQEP